MGINCLLRIGSQHFAPLPVGVWNTADWVGSSCCHYGMQSSRQLTMQLMPIEAALPLWHCSCTTHESALLVEMYTLGTINMAEDVASNGKPIFTSTIPIVQDWKDRSIVDWGSVGPLGIGLNPCNNGFLSLCFSCLWTNLAKWNIWVSACKHFAAETAGHWLWHAWLLAVAGADASCDAPRTSTL